MRRKALSLRNRRAISWRLRVFGQPHHAMSLPETAFLDSVNTP
jgi:hypothetical protein